MDCRPQDFSVHGIFQARMLEWVTISYFRWSSRPRNQTGILYVSCIGRWNLYPLNHLGSQNICVQFSCSIMSGSLQPLVLQHARLLCPSPTPGDYSNSFPSLRWCHPTISSSVIPFSSHLQSFPASGTFPMSQFFESGGQSIGVSASASVLPMNFQDWFPLGWTGWISLQSKGLSKVFSNTTVQKHPFFGLSFLYSPTLTSIHEYWKNHSFY